MKISRVESLIGAGIITAYMLSRAVGNELASDIVRLVAAMAVLAYVIGQRRRMRRRMDKGLPAEQRSHQK